MDIRIIPRKADLKIKEGQCKAKKEDAMENKRADLTPLDFAALLTLLGQALLREGKK